MNLIPVKTPKLIKGIFPNYVWNMPEDQKILYLTFDDGPTPEITNWTLDLLKSYQAKATFFCIGTNIEKHPGLFEAILKNGHAAGNHTFRHPKGWQTRTDVYLQEVLKTDQIISEQIQNSKSKIPKADNKHQLVIDNPPVWKRYVRAGQQSPLTEKTSSGGSSIPKLFRPPYGQITPKQGKQLLDLDYKIIMWDILAFDWKDSITPEQCAHNVISKAGNGSIIVFHDSFKASKNMMFSLPKILDYFSEKGFRFKHL